MTRLANITRVASARDFNYAVRSDGTVWAWGSNYLGTLGNGLTSGSFTPQRIQALTGIGAVAAGKSHGLAVSFTGAVWAWEYNNDGQLGDGTTVMRPTPVQIPGLGGIVTVAAGESHSLAVQSNGAMWGWGSNYHGQVGDGTIAGHWSPVPGVLTGVLAIAAGKRHSVALRSDGTIWTWGANYLGQLGDGTTAGRVMPAQVPGVAAATRIASGSLAEHTLIVRAVPRPGFQIAMGFESGTVPAGRSRAVPLTVKRVNGYAGQVALSVAGLLSSVRLVSFQPSRSSDAARCSTMVQSRPWALAVLVRAYIPPHV